jgi:2-keto-3-deoxy-L-rhamnonate aldolase RhmA
VNAAGVHDFPLRWSGETIVQVKTGNGTVNGEQVSWLVGALEAPANPGGRVIAMLMLEDPGAVAQAKEVADLKGYSIVACGIGSLAQAMGGDRAGAEAGTQKVLAEAKRAKLADMLTANPQDVAQRVKEGFLALMMQSPTADEAITIGRAAAGR